MHSMILTISVISNQTMIMTGFFVFFSWLFFSGIFPAAALCRYTVYCRVGDSIVEQSGFLLFLEMCSLFTVNQFMLSPLFWKILVNISLLQFTHTLATATEESCRTKIPQNSSNHHVTRWWLMILSGWGRSRPWLRWQLRNGLCKTAFQCATRLKSVDWQTWGRSPFGQLLFGRGWGGCRDVYLTWDCRIQKEMSRRLTMQPWPLKKKGQLLESKLLLSYYGKTSKETLTVALVNVEAKPGIFYAG